MLKYCISAYYTMQPLWIFTLKYSFSLEKRKLMRFRIWKFANICSFTFVFRKIRSHLLKHSISSICIAIIVNFLVKIQFFKGKLRIKQFRTWKFGHIWSFTSGIRKSSRHLLKYCISAYTVPALWIFTLKYSLSWVLKTMDNTIQNMNICKYM
jgi:hypothetical protein